MDEPELLTDIVSSRDEQREPVPVPRRRTIELPDDAALRRWTKVAASVVGCVLVAAYAGFHAGASSQRAPIAAATSATSPATATAVAPAAGPTTRPVEDPVEVADAWMAGHRALMVGDVLDYCTHYAGLGPGTLYSDLATCQHDEMRTAGAVAADPRWALLVAQQVADPARVDVRADSVALVWARDLILPSGAPVAQDGTDAFVVMRLLPGSGWRVVGSGTLHPYQVRGYSGPGLPRPA